MSDSEARYEARHPSSDRGLPLVAICMATFDPPPGLFERQVLSIAAQTHDRFVCIVCDDASGGSVSERLAEVTGRDERFVVFPGSERLGFYRNFERALSLVPRDAGYVAFSDQDDFWRPDKLETLVWALVNSRALLAYSDMHIVSADGELIATSAFADRRNNSTSLSSLMLMNTVAGASVLFRRELLDDALPFPAHASQYHDHWIACLALALGELVYVDRALFDYVQHESNVVGRDAPLSDDFKGGLVHAVRRFGRDPSQRLRAMTSHAPDYYFNDVARLEILARTLRRRLARRMTPGKARDVRRIAGLSSPISLAWLVARSACDIRGESETLGMENQLIKGILWHWQDATRRRLGL